MSAIKVYKLKTNINSKDHNYKEREKLEKTIQKNDNGGVNNIKALKALDDIQLKIEYRNKKYNKEDRSNNDGFSKE